MHLPWSIKPSGSGREREGSRGEGGRGGRGGEGGNPGRGGLLGFSSGGGRGHLRIRATGADRVKVTGNELGDARVAPIGEMGGLPGVWVGIGKGFGVTVIHIVHGVDPREVGVEGGAVICGCSWGGGFVFEPGDGGGRGLRCWGVTGGGGTYPM